jgi:hypothetical protein
MDVDRRCTAHDTRREARSTAHDTSMRHAHTLEVQMEQRTAASAPRCDAIAGQSGDEPAYDGQSVVARP